MLKIIHQELEAWYYVEFSCAAKVNFIGFIKTGQVMYSPTPSNRIAHTFQKSERNDLIAAYYRRLTSEDVSIRRAAAKEWTRWEMATSRMFPDPDYLEKAEDLDFAVAFARIECHYFINGIFVEDGHILNNCDKIVNIPTTIIQGRYDMVCPTKSAWELHKALQNSNLWLLFLMLGTRWVRPQSLGNWLRLLTKFSTSSNH